MEIYFRFPVAVTFSKGNQFYYRIGWEKSGQLRMGGGKILNVLFLGARLMAGLQTLDLPVEVRILCPQLQKNHRKVIFDLIEVLTSHGGSRVLCPQPH